AKDIRIHDGNQQTLTLNNTSGEILAGQNLDIQAKTLAKQGTLAANQNLSLNLKDSFTAEQDIRAGQGLSVSSEGDINNSYTLEGGRFALLEAQNINNTAAGVIQSGSDTRLTAQNLTNRGLINSNGLTLLDAGNTVLNIGTGRVYGGWVGIEADKLVNQEETANGETKAATIAARGHLAVGAKEVLNLGTGFHKIADGKLQSGTSSSLITSLGTLSVGGRLNEDYDAAGNSETLVNKGARIESDGNMVLNVRQIHNLNSRLEIDKKVHIQSHGSEHSVSAPGNPEWWVNGKDGRFWQTGDHAKGQFDFTDGRASVISEVWNEKQVNVDVYQDQLKHSEPGQIIAGGNLRVDSNEFLNQDSQILIGGTWQGSDQSKVLKNSAAQSELITTEKGYGKQTYSKKSKSFKWGRKDRNGYSIDAVRSIETKPFENDFVHYEEGSSGLAVATNAIAAALNPTAVTHGGSTPAPVKTLNTATKLPTSGLYAVNPANPSYLVETDPAFANYKQWLGSGYMLNALKLDPSHMHKRLGDGYYEQKLVNEQVARLTGYRRLDGYSNDEEQFKALMEAGITFAREQQLTPGIALSPEQAARLTSDIVWLEEQTLTLIDGSTVTVLAPKVYLTVKPGDINAHGGLISADKLAVDGAGSIVNSGTLAGRKIVDLSATDIQNSGVVQGGKVRLRGQDVNIDGGTVEADTLLAVEAGRIRVASTTVTNGDGRNGQTQIDRVAGLYVNNASDGLLSLKANESIDFVAADLRNEAAKGQTQIVSDGRIGLGTAKL
ncbi:S-layer family protein, partial [Neisseria weixii]